MSTEVRQVQLRRGTHAEHKTFTGATGEVTYVTDDKELRIHDSSTAGGIGLRTKSAAEIKDNDNFKIILGNYTDGTLTDVSKVMFGTILGDWAFNHQDWPNTSFTRADWQDGIYASFTTLLSSDSDARLTTLTEGVA
jgi:hypothetical protein